MTDQPSLNDSPTPVSLTRGRCFFVSIEREISGIGFQPVDPDLTGWKPIPRYKFGSHFHADANRSRNSTREWHSWAVGLDFDRSWCDPSLLKGLPANHANARKSLVMKCSLSGRLQAANEVDQVPDILFIKFAFDKGGRWHRGAIDALGDAKVQIS